jgi:hypothetical protein
MFLLSELATIATAIGLLLAASQLFTRPSPKHYCVRRRFAREYRKLVRPLPKKAFLGEPLSDEEHC